MCYDTWKTNHPSEYDYDPYEDYIHVDEVVKYDDAKDWLKEILQHVYVTGNVQLFEYALEELCSIFEVNLPKTKTKFKKERPELFDFAVQLTQDYAATITK